MQSKAVFFFPWLLLIPFQPKSQLVGGNSNISNFHPKNWGRSIHFDEHIFQRGWNHQLVKFFFLGKYPILICAWTSLNISFFTMTNSWHRIRVDEAGEITEKNRAYSEVFTNDP